MAEDAVKAFFYGSLTIEIVTEELERFLNICSYNDLILWDLQAEDKSTKFCVYKKDFEKYEEIGKKTSCRLHIIKENGWPYLFRKIKARKSFFFGIFLGIFLIIAASQCIWRVEIYGNFYYGEDTIRRFLRTEGINSPCMKNQINCLSLAADIRKEFPRVVWVSVKRKGAYLTVELKENELIEEKSEETNLAAADLVSEYNGKVVSIVTRNGTAQVKTGDLCSKGQIMISGMIPLVNEASEVYDYEKTKADGDVFLQYKIYYYNEIPRIQEIKVIKKEQKSVSVFLGHHLCGMFPQKWFDRSQFILVNENTKWGMKIHSFTYEKEKNICSEKEIKAMAVEGINRELARIRKKGVQILKNDVTIDINDASCISKGTFTVIGKAGVPKAITAEPVLDGKDIMNEQ
ncbi:MAG: sporulation protein YqfD [Lachnospiraceae bacterium]|nr:sporulation protein YqfD [Lachnospiraceae bacterium]MDD3615880.1 sporulation protein YqfD [Lachnospiraceae bacterium]